MVSDSSDGHNSLVDEYSGKHDGFRGGIFRERFEHTLQECFDRGALPHGSTDSFGWKDLVASDGDPFACPTFIKMRQGYPE